mgnify:CR=1 FL=1
MIIQVYEIQTKKEAEGCIELGVDHVGSVLLDPRDAINLKEVVQTVQSHGKLSSVLPIFKGADDIIKVIKVLMPDILHLCDDLMGDSQLLLKAIELQMLLKKEFKSVRIMRTLPIPVKGGNFETIRNMVEHLWEMTDFFLLDTWVQKSPVEGFVGITGVPCDWELASRVVDFSPRPCILAGGLSPENVYDAILKVKPFGVDTCTQTNKRDAKGNVIRFTKDLERLKLFIGEARKAYLEICGG